MHMQVPVVYGVSDFLKFKECHEHIRDVLASAGNPDVQLAVIPDEDHACAMAKSKRESYENFKTGRFIIDSWVFEETVD